MPKSSVEVEVCEFAGSDAELLVKLDELVQTGRTLMAIHDRGDVRYLYFYRSTRDAPCIKWEQERICCLGGDERDVQAIIERESQESWRFATVYCGKNGVIQLFFVRLVPSDIEEKGQRRVIGSR